MRCWTATYWKSSVARWSQNTYRATRPLVNWKGGIETREGYGSSVQDDSCTHCMLAYRISRRARMTRDSSLSKWSLHGRSIHFSLQTNLQQILSCKNLLSRWSYESHCSILTRRTLQENQHAHNQLMVFDTIRDE